MNSKRCLNTIHSEKYKLSKCTYHRYLKRHTDREYFESYSVFCISSFWPHWCIVFLPLAGSSSQSSLLLPPPINHCNCDFKTDYLNSVLFLCIMHKITYKNALASFHHSFRCTLWWRLLNPFCWRIKLKYSVLLVEKNMLSFQIAKIITFQNCEIWVWIMCG